MTRPENPLGPCRQYQNCNPNFGMCCPPCAWNAGARAILECVVADLRDKADPESGWITTEEEMSTFRELADRYAKELP